MLWPCIILDMFPKISAIYSFIRKPNRLNHILYYLGHVPKNLSHLIFYKKI